jgi:hypothetical protein
MPGTYGKTWWRDGYACGCMIQSVEDVIEPRLRDAGILGASEKVYVYQQAYNGSVSASAGTHGEGGALDGQRGGDKELRIWRECGVAMWPRGNPYDSMDIHQHGVWLGCPHLSDEAADQAYDYKQGRNGLANNGSDPGPDVAYITWQDAYDKFSDQGVLGMTEIEKYHASKDQTFTGNDEWQTVKIDDEGDGALSFLTGPKDAFMVTACYAWAGLEPGEVTQFRFQMISDYSDDRASVVESEYPIQESVATEGTTYGQIVWANNLGSSPKDGAKSRLRLYVSPPKGREVILKDLTSRVLWA